jgi:hypothetical protein
MQTQVFPADLVIGPDNAALQDRPEALDCIGVNCANDMLANGVIDRLMREVAVQSLIARISVSAEKVNAVRYSFSRNCAADFLGAPRFESVREKPALA